MGTVGGSFSKVEGIQGGDAPAAGEYGHKLIVPDIHPDTLYPKPRPRHPDSPERRLMMELFQQGLQDAFGTNREARREAWEWIRSPKDCTFGFAWCCYHMGYDPDDAREALERKRRGAEASQSQPV